MIKHCSCYRVSHYYILFFRATSEIDEIMDGKTSIDDEDLDKMTYVTAVIEETLRLHQLYKRAIRRSWNWSPTKYLKELKFWSVFVTTVGCSSSQKDIATRNLESLLCTTQTFSVAPSVDHITKIVVLYYNIVISLPIIRSHTLLLVCYIHNVCVI